ncbi:MAG TPA: flagellar motor switch phosphatase FliY [Bacillota bacterium]|nr:flagellar motor switch phosphatase FliY [Bacillota bacterium]
MNDGLLSQQEINSLLQKNEDLNNDSELTEGEKDVLGETVNISLSSLAMALSEMLGKEASVSDMQIGTTNLPEIQDGLDNQYLIIQAQLEGGLQGTTMMVLEADKVATITNLAEGKEIKASPADFTEADMADMKDTMGKMLTKIYGSLSDMLKKEIGLSKLDIWMLGPDTDMGQVADKVEGDIVRVDFSLHIGDMDDNAVALAFCIGSARDIINDLSSLDNSIDTPGTSPQPEDETKVIAETRTGGRRSVSIQKPQFGQLEENAAAGKKQNIDLILDVPLELSVVLGDTTKSIKEVLSLNPGSVIELGKYTEEPLEVYVNGKLIAQGEVVVINENFGIRITNIISAAERVKNL